jgi:hypothetical protein
LPPVLSPEQVCDFLGIKTRRPDKWLRARAVQGLKILKVGKALRVLSRDLHAWLETQNA